MIIEFRDHTGRQFRVGDPMPDRPQLTVTSIEWSMNGGLIVHQSGGGSLHLISDYVDWYSVQRGNE